MFQKQYENCEKRLKILRSQCTRVSFCRLIFSIAAVLLLCLGYSKAFPVYYLLSAVSAFIFLQLVSYDHKLQTTQTYLTDYQNVIHDYEARLGDGWKQFPIHGVQYLRDDSCEAADLDIFGKNSLYQYLCTASTVFGQDQLAHWLNPADQKTIQDIHGRQQAVKELAEKTDFSLHFEASARCLRNVSYDASKKVLDDFFCALEQKSSIPLAVRIAIRVVPVLTLAFLLAFLSGFNKELMVSCFLTAAMLQLFAALLGHGRTSRLLGPVYKMNQTITPYRKLMEQLIQESFDSPYLRQLQQTLTGSAKDDNSVKHTNTGAVNALKELEAIADSVVIRHNIYASFILNSLFCFDFHCVERYCKWKQTYQSALCTWLEAVGAIEALISLGVICHTRQIHTLPQIIHADKPKLSAVSLRHPLLKEADAVGNDFDLIHNTCIITGSNMSGKTTFMRSIGINLVLAYAGAYCTASDLCVSYMRLCTSMRTKDNVNEGISTFYAELLRIKKIMEAVREQKPILSLIDEIYKGTNAKDRIFAARETIKNISRPYAYTILTTHDFELCDLENDSHMDAENYYFSEHYCQDKILFDYKIKQGRCTTANARYLLHMAGIL